ncbi:MAG: DUF5715 family protein [Patescibacteria group bacterium]
MKFLSYVLALAVVLASFAPQADAGRRKRRRGSDVPSALRGGKAVQKRHNRQANADDLTRLEKRDDLERFIDLGLLVPVDDTRSYYLDSIGGHDPGHEDLYRHARPWTKRFLDKELSVVRTKFGHRSKLTSFVRTDTYQGRICRSGNGAAICGGDWWEQSLHLTGATVDISKEGMSRKTLAWMRKRLVQLQRQSLVSAIEERGAFHVFVRKAYGKAAKRPTKAQKPKKAEKKKRHRRARR